MGNQFSVKTIISQNCHLASKQLLKIWTLNDIEIDRWIWKDSKSIMNQCNKSIGQSKGRKILLWSNGLRSSTNYMPLIFFLKNIFLMIWVSIELWNHGYNCEIWINPNYQFAVTMDTMGGSYWNIVNQGFRMACLCLKYNVNYKVFASYQHSEIWMW